MRCLLSSRLDRYMAFARPLATILLIGAASTGIAADPQVRCTVAHVDATAPAASDKARDLAHKIEATDPCTIAPGVKVKSLRMLWANLVNGSRVGGKRFEAPLPPGVPSGTVLAGPVRFDFSAVANEQPNRFVLTSGSHTIIDSAPPPPSYTFEHPSPDTTYSWVLVTSRQSYKAKFDVLPDDESRVVANKIAMLEKVIADPMTRAFYEAAIYDDAGLYSDRDAVLGTIRNGIAP